MTIEPRRKVQQILQELERFDPNKHDAEDIDEYLVQLSALPHSEEVIESLLKVFERFPEEDNDAFWSILHWIEAYPRYEPRLIESVRRQPAEFNTRMLNRILNSGQTHVEGTDLMQLLEEAAANPNCPSTVREQVEGFIEHQTS